MIINSTLIVSFIIIFCTFIFTMARTITTKTRAERAAEARRASPTCHSTAVHTPNKLGARVYKRAK